MERACYVPNQPYILISVSKLTMQQDQNWESPNFVDCTCMNDTGTTFKFSYEHREFSGNLTLYRVQESTWSSVHSAPLRSPGAPPIQSDRPPKPAAISQDLPMQAPSPAAANYHTKIGVPVSELSKRGAQPRDDCQLVKSYFQLLSTKHSIGGQIEWICS